MADITDPEVIRFTNERVRTYAEKLRAVKAEGASLVAAWFSLGVNSRCPNTTDLLQDGRANEGASRLTGADINSLVGQAANISSQFNADIIEKPCIRPLDIR